jgi:type I restriction enzyme S subunit
MGGECPIANTAGWPVVSLKDITTKIGSGATPRGGSASYLDTRSTFALVRSQNVFDRRFDREGLAYITDEQADALKGVMLREGDILLNITGDGITFARACVVPNDVLPACVNQHVSIIRVDLSTADPGYVLSFLTHDGVKLYIEAFNAGGSRRAITKGHIESFRLPLPALSEQRAIAHILGTLDDKIELNRCRNQTLEAMARALFKDWFVDFGPVRAKMAGQEPYLPADLWQLFPERLDEEGKPEGWDEWPLDEIADFLNGLAMQKFPATDPDDSLPVIKIAELRNGISAKSDRASREVPAKYIIKDGDFLFSWSGSLLAKFWTEGEGALNQHLFKVTSKRYPMWFVSHWVHHHLEEFQAIAASKATTMGHIQRGHLKVAMTICPLDDVVKRFGDVMAPLVEQTIQNELESRSLAQLRDTLLPKLISGQLRIADAESFMERVEALAT